MAVPGTPSSSRLRRGGLAGHGGRGCTLLAPGPGSAEADVALACHLGCRPVALIGAWHFARGARTATGPTDALHYRGEPRQHHRLVRALRHFRGPCRVRGWGRPRSPQDNGPFFTSPRKRFRPHGGGARPVVRAGRPDRAGGSGAWGGRLVFFPEGGLSPEPGVRRFQLGAFVVASQVGLPVVPLAILGTREILPPNARLPRRCDVEVRVGKAVDPTVPGWAAARDVASQARSAIEALLSESAA